jgi:hypothetical protein
MIVKNDGSPKLQPRLFVTANRGIGTYGIHSGMYLALLKP